MPATFRHRCRRTAARTAPPLGHRSPAPRERRRSSRCRCPGLLMPASTWCGTAPRSRRSRRALRRSHCLADRATRASTCTRRTGRLSRLPIPSMSSGADRMWRRTLVLRSGSAGLKPCATLRAICATFCLVVASLATVQAQELVTPVRVGDPDAPMTLSVWAQQDYSHLAARPAIASTFTAVFEDWARAHRDVQLRVSVMPGLELHKAKLQLAAAANRLPDIASIDSFWLPLLADHVQPLDVHWPAEDRADLLPFTIQTLSRDGHVYGFWHETDCRVLFYRTDLVPTPPRTWDELLTTASRVSRERRVAGYLYNAGRWEATVFDHLAMFWAQGGELVDEAGRPIFGEGANRAAMLRLLGFLRDT